jgi:hypothetical protein
VLAFLVVFMEIIAFDEFGTTNSDVVLVTKVEDDTKELKLELFSSFRSNSILPFPRSLKIV